jgi:hypothetical protein
MSIKLKFEKGSLATQVILKDEAFAGLLDLISKHQSDEAPPPAAPGASATTFSLSPNTTSDPGAPVKEWLRRRSAAEVLNTIGWDSNPEKVLLLGAFHEAGGDDDAWRSADMEARFAEAREGFPANFPRDIRAAIRDGLIATVTPRTYRVSRTGWNRIAEAILKPLPESM